MGVCVKVCEDVCVCEGVCVCVCVCKYPDILEDEGTHQSDNYIPLTKTKPLYNSSPGYQVCLVQMHFL